MNEQKTKQALEMARCANCNMDNMLQWQPSVKTNPMFIIVRAQLHRVIDLLESGDGELKIDPLHYTQCVPVIETSTGE